MKTQFAENNRENIYKLLLEKEMTTDEIAEAMQLRKSKIANYVRTMSDGGYLICTKAYNQFMSRTICSYRAVEAKPYVALVQKTQAQMRAEARALREKEWKKKEKPDTTNPHARVIRLLDKEPLAPAPKTKRSAYKGIGSSFSMFDYY